MENTGGSAGTIEKHEKLFTILSYTLQIILWCLIILLATDKSYLILSIITGVVYITYIILCGFLSRSFSYLLNIKKKDNILNYIRDLKTIPITLSYYIECYHIIGSGKNYERVVTFSTTKVFKEYAWKDISEVVNIRAEGKGFVKLQLGYSYEFTDSVVKGEFAYFKGKALQMYSKRDKFIDVITEIKLTGFEKYTLIKISDRGYIFVHIFWYVLSTFLGLVEIYKIYLNCLCVKYNFEIKKLISSRSNLAPICPSEEQENNDCIIEENNIHINMAPVAVVANNENSNKSKIEKDEKIEEVRDILYDENEVSQEENSGKHCYKDTELENLDNI
jgi:hypothetical protein